MKKIMIAVSGMAMLGGCAVSQPPEVLAQRNPADGRESVRNSHYNPVISDYNSRKPVDPKSWRQLNDEQAPKKESRS